MILPSLVWAQSCSPPWPWHVAISTWWERLSAIQGLRWIIKKNEKGCWWSEKEGNYQQIEKYSWYWERKCTIWECQIGSAPFHVVVGTERTLGRNCLLAGARTFTSQVDVLVCFPLDTPHSNIVLDQIRNIQLISLLGEREELRTGHEVVTRILA